MSGHSKWSNIKHKKASTDAKKAQVFTKILREITVAVKIGGSDVQTNPKLRLAIDKARGANLTRDNIEKAIKRASGEDKDKTYIELVYEGYASHGVAIIVECLTDSKNRSASEIRSAFNKFGGNMGETGCVSYMFEKKGLIFYSKSKYKEDDIFEKALEYGAQDVSSEDDEMIEVSVPVEIYLDFLENMRNDNFIENEAQIMNVPSNYIELKKEDAKGVLKLIEKLDDLDDTQNIWHNLQLNE